MPTYPQVTLEPQNMNLEESEPPSSWLSMPRVELLKHTVGVAGITELDLNQT